MQDSLSINTIFVAIAVIFVVVAPRDYLKTEGKMTIGRKIRLRAGIIFADPRLD